MAEGFLQAPAQPISDVPTEKETFGVSNSDLLDFSTSASVVSSRLDLPLPVLERRARNIDYAMGDRSPGPRALVDEFRVPDGYGSVAFREAAMADYRFEQKKETLVSDYLRTVPTGTEPDENQIRALQSITRKEAEDPETIFPKLLAQRVAEQKVINRSLTDEAIASAKAGVAREIVPSLSVMMDRELEKSGERIREIVAHRALINELQEELQERYKATGWGTFADDALFNLIGTGVWNTRNIFDGNAEGVLKGNNIASQRQRFLSEDISTAGPKLAKAVRELADTNIIQALDYIKAFGEQGDWDRYLENTMGVIDTAGLASVPFDVAALGGLSVRMARGAQAAIRGNTVNPAMVALAGGRSADAAYIQAIQNIKNKASVGTAGHTFQDVVTNAPSILDISSLRMGAAQHNVTSLPAQVIEDRLKVQAAELLKTVDANTIVRVADEEDLARQLAQTRFQSRYDLPGNVVMNIRPVRTDDQLTNVMSAEVILGNRSRELFASKLSAELAAVDDYKLSEFEVKPFEQGPGYFISVKYDVDERSMDLYNIAKTWDGTTVGQYASLFRGADAQLSKSQRETRKSLAYGEGRVLDLFRRITEPLTPTLGDKNFVDFLRSAHAAEKDYRTLGEFEMAWYKKSGRPATEQEAVAYFTVQQIRDTDLIVRNNLLRSAKVQLGYEQHLLPRAVMPDTSFKSPEQDTGFVSPDLALGAGSNTFKDRNAFSSSNLSGTKVRSPIGNDFKGGLRADSDEGTTEINVEGKYLKDGLPVTQEAYHVTVWGDTALRHINRNRFFNTGQRQELEQLINNEGYRVIQVSPKGREALRKMPEFKSTAVPDFVLVKTFKSKALDQMQMSVTAGGHRIVDDSVVYVSQPKVQRIVGEFPETTYFGDINVFGFADAKVAERYLPHLERAREILASRNTVSLKQYLAANLPISDKEFIAAFKSGELDVNVPLMLRAKGESTFDRLASMRSPNGEATFPFLRSRKDIDLDQQMTGVAFSQERSDMLRTFYEETVNGKTALKIGDTPLVDPVETIQRAGQNMLTSVYMNDYITSAAREFVNAFGDYLTVSKEELVRFPEKYIRELPLRKDAPAGIKSQASAYRLTFLHILNQETETMTRFKNTMKKIIGDNVPFGEKVTNSNPVSFITRAAFVANMGMFNFQQILMQAAQIPTLMGITGSATKTAKALSATSASALMGRSADEALVRYTANRLKAVGWEPREFMESMKALEDVGFRNVSGTQGMLEHGALQRTTRGAAEKVVDASTMFFRHTESYLREVSWHSAYQMWREANPKVRFDRRAQQEVLDLADNMAGATSKASSAPWQYGLVNVPLLFSGFQFRLADQITGKQLTRQQRFNIVLANTVAYGVPVGLFGSVAGVAYPWHEVITEYYLKKDQVLSDEERKQSSDWIRNVLSFEGVVGALGGENFKPEERFGPGGVSLIKDLFTSDKTKTEILFGPGGRVIYDLIDKALYKPLANTLRMTEASVNGDDGYKITVDDLNDIARNIRTYDIAVQAWMGMNFQQMLLKNNAKVDITASEALVNLVTGVTPERVNEMYRKQEILAERRKAKDKVSVEILGLYRKLFNAHGDERVQAQYAFRIRALSQSLGLTPTEHNALTDRAMSDNMDRVIAIDNRFDRAVRASEGMKKKPDTTPEVQ